MAHKNKENRSPYTDRQRAKKKRSQKPLQGRHRRPDETFSFEEANDRIYDIFCNHGFSDYSHDKRRLLCEFYFLLMKSQQNQNFTRLLKLRDVAIKHFIDSLIVSQLTELTFPLLDIGTGPGFPGIPLKIEHPDKKIILAEGVQKRVEFLKHVRDSLSLPDLDIVGRNINDEFVYPVQGVITRAVEDIGNTLGNCIHCLQKGGRVFLMKGPNVDPEIQPALDQWGDFYKLVDDIAYELPNTQHQRRLVVFEKIKIKELEL